MQIINSGRLKYRRKQGLRFQNPEVQNHEEITSIDSGGADIVHGVGRYRSEPSV
jgi:hypothetical protein